MRARPPSWLVVVLVAACGNTAPEQAPVLRAEPAAPPAKAPATATAAPPAAAPAVTTPPTTPPTPPAPVVQAPLPPPPSPDDDPSRVPLAVHDTELGTDVQYDTEPIAEGFHMEADLPVLGDEAKTAALASRVRMDVRRVLAGDPSVMPRNYEGRCNLTLVTASLVSYMCQYSVTEYGDRESWTNTGRVGLTYQIGSRWPVPALVPSWFVPGTDVGTIADVACRKVGQHRDVFGGAGGCDPEDVEFAIQDNGLRVGWPLVGTDEGAEPERSELVLGWNELGKLVRRDGPLGTLASAVANADAETPLSRVAGPPPAGTTVLAIGEEGDLKEIARRWSFEHGVRVMLTDAAAGRARLIRARGVASSSVDALPVSRTNVPFVLPQLGVGARRIRRATALRSAPRADAGVVAPLVGGTIVATLSGPIGSDESSLTPGMWTYVVPNASTAGWIPSGLLGSRSSTPERRGPDVAGQGPRTFTVALSDPSASLLVHYTPTADGSHTELVAVVRGAEPLTLGPLDGSIADLRLTRVERGGEPLLLVALARSGSPDSLQWQAYRLGAGQPRTAVLDVALPTDLSLPEAQRTAVRAGIQNRGRFAPFLVRRRGAADVVYTWNGTALQTGGT